MWERLVIPLFKTVVSQATPEIRKSLTSFLDDFEEKAKATVNPFDNLLVMIVRDITDL